MADKDLKVRFGVGHLSYQKKQRTRITYKSPTQVTSPWIGVNCSSAEWYQNRGEGVLNLRRDVDTIGGGASTDYSPFYGNTSVTEVVLPNEITNIGDYAFDGCTSLESVVITSEVPPTLGDNVFEDTTTVYVPYEYLDAYEEAWGDEVEIAPIGNYYKITVTAGEHGSATGSGWYALNESAVLTATADEGYEFTQWSDGNTDNPRTITVLGDATYTCAFQALKLIRYTSTNQASGNWVTNNTDTTKNTYDSVTGNGVLYLNSGVTTIGGGWSTNNSPFYQDRGLTAVDLDNAGLTIIDMYAFTGCSGLASVEWENSGITSIGDNAFVNCSGLTSATIPSSVISIGEGAFGGCSSLTSVTIGNGVASIGVSAFSGCAGLTSINIPSSVTSISRNAFDYCTGLTSATIGSGVISIGQYAFGGCSNLTSVTCEATTPPTLGTGNFGSATNDVLYVPEASIDAYYNNDTWRTAFAAILPIGTTKAIVYEAASQATGNWVTNNTNTSKNYYNSTKQVGYLYLNSDVTIIGGGGSTDNSPFYQNSDLTSVNLAFSGLTAINNFAFRDSALTTVTLPSTLTHFGNSVFRQCASLVTVKNFENTAVTTRQDREGLFMNCTALKNITLPPALTYIGYADFRSCSSLTTIDLPSTVTNIGSYAFYGCSNLKTVTCRATTPPTLNGNNFNATGDTLYVPAASVSAYQSDSSWSAAFTTITAIS